MEKSPTNKSQKSLGKPVSRRPRPPTHGSVEHLQALFGAHVARATWEVADFGGVPVMTSVVFFDLARAPKSPAADQPTAGLHVVPPRAKTDVGDWDETAEMKTCRLAAESAKSGVEAEQHAVEYRRLLQNRMAYYSS